MLKESGSLLSIQYCLGATRSDLHRHEQSGHVARGRAAGDRRRLQRDTVAETGLDFFGAYGLSAKSELTAGCHNLS